MSPAIIRPTSGTLPKCPANEHPPPLCTAKRPHVPEDLVYRSLVAQNYTRLENYRDLEQLHHQHDGRHLGSLADSIKHRLLRTLEEDMEPITEVGAAFRKHYPDEVGPMAIDGLCLGGMANCVNLHSLYDSLDETGDRSFAILTIHPDDWVAGKSAIDPKASWMNHGKLRWNTMPVTNLEDRQHGLREVLISPLSSSHNNPPLRRPAKVDGLVSPVVDHCLIELEDSTAAPVLKFFPNACRFLAAHLSVPGRKAMVHCKAGRSRGPAFTVAFMLYRYYHALIEPNPTRYPTTTPCQRERVVDHLQDMARIFMQFLAQIRPEISTDNKFERQLELWAWQLVHQRRPPKLPTEKPKAGGGDMRDAAIIEFYMRGQRPLPNLVQHWYKRCTAGEARWRAAEAEKARREPGEGRLGGPKVKMQEYISHWNRVMQMEASGELVAGSGDASSSLSSSSRALAGYAPWKQVCDEAHHL